MRITAISLLLATALVGCATDDDFGEDTAEPDDSVQGDGKADGDVVQRYALELTSKTRIEDTRETNPAKRYTDLQLKARAAVAVVQQGENITLFVRLCDVKLPAIGGYQPQLDPAFVSAIPQLNLVGKVETNTDGSRTLTTNPAAMVLGAQLAHPLTDALPTDKNDPRVRDQDGDHKVGVSLLIPHTVKIFGTMRLILSLDATYTNPNTINGDADVQVSHSVLDDDSFFVNVKDMDEEAAPYTNVVSADNNVRMKAGGANCAAVRTAFPWAP